jgi:hypothetical protein
VADIIADSDTAGLGCLNQTWLPNVMLKVGAGKSMEAVRLGDDHKSDLRSMGVGMRSACKFIAKMRRQRWNPSVPSGLWRTMNSVSPMARWWLEEETLEGLASDCHNLAKSLREFFEHIVDITGSDEQPSKRAHRSAEQRAEGRQTPAAASGPLAPPSQKVFASDDDESLAAASSLSGELVLSSTPSTRSRREKRARNTMRLSTKEVLRAHVDLTGLRKPSPISVDVDQRLDLPFV